MKYIFWWLTEENNKDLSEWRDVMQLARVDTLFPNQRVVIFLDVLLDNRYIWLPLTERITVHTGFRAEFFFFLGGGKKAT